MSASENGRDIIQDGGRKRKWLLLLDRDSKTLPLLLLWINDSSLMNMVKKTAESAEVG